MLLLHQRLYYLHPVILPDPDTVSVMQSKHGVDLPVTLFGRKSDTKANKGVKAFCS